MKIDEEILREINQPYDDWAAYKKDSISIKDLAYLSAATKHEFALLRGKRNDLLFHGVERHCNFEDELIELLKEGKYKLIAHTHPDFIYYGRRIKILFELL